MIDFKNSKFFKLKKVSAESVKSSVIPLLTNEEEIISAYRGLRDEVIFTNKRIIAVNTQGFSGTKKDFTSMPYCKVQVYSVETAGLREKITETFGGDCELELYFSGVGKVRFEFRRDSDIEEICRTISKFVLG